MQCGITVSGQHSPKDLFFQRIGRCLLIVASIIPWVGAVVAPAIVAPDVAMAQDEDAAADGAVEPDGESMLVFYYKALGLRYVIVFFGPVVCARGPARHVLPADSQCRPDAEGAERSV